MSEEITAKLAAVRMATVIEDAKRENVDRDERHVLARLAYETASSDPWTAATKLFGKAQEG